MADSAPLGQTDSLERQVQLADLELKKQQLADARKEPPRKSLWTTLLEGLALPAAVIAIVVQLTSASGEIKTGAKTEAETTKAKVDTAKALVETEKLQLEVTKLKSDASTVPREDLQKLIPRLQESVDQLRALQVRPDAGVWPRAITKYILVWALLHLVGLIFDIIQNVWQSLVQSIYLALVSREPKAQTEVAWKRHRVLSRWASWGQTFLQPVPSVFRWSIQLSIFGALIIPLFDEVARTYDPRLSFEGVWNNISHLRIGLALADMKAALFVAANPF